MQFKIILKKFFRKISNIRNDRFKLILLIIFIIGVTIRFMGVYPGYSPYHPDEGKAGYTSAAYMLINKTLDLPRYSYPALIPLLQLVFLIFFYVPAVIVHIFFSEPSLFVSHFEKVPVLLETYLAGSKDIWIMYWSRYLAVLFGSLTLLFTYLVAKKLFSSRLAALFALIILSVNLRAITSSQLDLPDVYSGFFLVLAFYIIIKLIEKQSLRWFIFSGIGLGLSISAKLQFFSLAPFIFAHFYLVSKKSGFLGKLTAFFSREIIFAFLVLILTIVLINVSPLLNFSLFYETMVRQSNLYGFGINVFSLTGLSYFYHIILTPAVAFLFLFGIVAGLKKNRLSTILVIGIIIPYLYYFLYLTRGWFYPRNFVSVIPFFAILAGVGLNTIWNFLYWHIKKNTAVVLFICILFGLLFESAKNSLIHTVNYIKPWNITSMRDCINKNILENKIVAAHPTDKYILFSLPSIDVNKKLSFVPLNIETAPNFNLAELQSQKADYVLLGLDVVQDNNSNWWMVQPQFWNKPKEISKNIFISLAANEFFAHTICAVVKPWQAVESSYVFASVPPKIDFQGEEIFSYNFDNEDQKKLWNKIDGFSGKGTNLVFSKDGGRSNSGALQIGAAQATFPVIRWVSPLFPIDKNFTYKAQAWIRSSTNLSEKQKDGFLRLDFYEKEPIVWNEETGSLNTFLSARYFGSSEWKMEQVIGTPPQDAKYATISFQVSNPSVATFWLDDVMVYKSQSKNSSPILGQGGYQLVVDDNILVPQVGSGY